MEFWGVEVKAGVPLKCVPGDDKYLHLSQAALGEVKKDKLNAVVLSLQIDGQKIILGTLAPEKCSQLSFDLVFEKDFELSHNGKSSVYFCGYKSLVDDEEYDPKNFAGFEDDSDEELDLTPNGMPVIKEVQPRPPKEKANAAKPELSALKQSTKVAEREEDESDSDEEMLGVGEESTEEKKATPKKMESGKKRAPGSAIKTPVPEKKAKVASPGQTPAADGKKGGHVATPHPNKKAAKAPATNEKSKKEKTPKSGGQISCQSCTKTFSTEAAMQSHTNAKHSGDK